MSSLSALAKLDTFERLGAGQRSEIARLVAESLGPEFAPHSAPLGARGYVAVDHAPTGACCVVVPGGAFEMGLSDADIAEAKQHIDASDVDFYVSRQGAAARPVHTVAVTPFLLTRDVLTLEQVATLSGGAQRRPSMRPADVAAFAGRLQGFRLPSEAELEFVMREGGAVRFVNDGARAFTQTGRFPKENGWGFTGLTTNAWSADEWHDSYEGAPATSAPWTSGGAPGVFRGDLPWGPEYPAALTAALAAYRGRWDDSQENEVCVRLARSLALG